eukprot:jgi/Chlat1/6482/Chrsp45S06058
MTERVLCRYFLHGACRNADCRFSHDLRAGQPETVCRYYLQGRCSFGSSCRYDHSRPKPTPFSPPSPPPHRETAVTSTTSEAQYDHQQQVAECLRALNLASSSESESVCASESDRRDTPEGETPVAEESKSAWAKPHAPPSQTDVDDWEYSGQYDGWERAERVARIRASTDASTAPPRLDPAELPICPLAAAGLCTRGEACPAIHGDECPHCHKLCLHPHRQAEREEHLAECQRQQERAVAFRRSEDVECAVCLEKVLSKANPADRKFGVLEGCEHAFCLACIRDWRAGPHVDGMDMDTVVRACPVCRQPSHFVTPSTVWVQLPEEKARLIEGYKSRLKAIDCRHFNFGEGKTAKHIFPVHICYPSLALSIAIHTRA